MNENQVNSKQFKLYTHCWKEMDQRDKQSIQSLISLSSPMNGINHEITIIHKLLKSYINKEDRWWVDEIKRCLFKFRPPKQSKETVWDQFHHLIETASTPNHYEKAMKVIIPVLAEFGSIDDGYKVFEENIEFDSLSKTNKDYKEPELRAITCFLEVCLKKITQNENEEEKNELIEIARDLYKIFQKYKSMKISKAPELFDYLFIIFIYNKQLSLEDFNILFVQYVKCNNVDRISTDSTNDSMMAHFGAGDNKNIEIDFVDYIAEYFSNTLHEKVIIISSDHRVNQAKISHDKRTLYILSKWEKNKWLVCTGNKLNKNVLWALNALHSCFKYNRNVTIITNADMKGPLMDLIDVKGLLRPFLESKLC